MMKTLPVHGAMRLVLACALAFCLGADGEEADDTKSPQPSGSHASAPEPSVQQTDEIAQPEPGGAAPCAQDAAAEEPVQIDGREYIDGTLVVPARVAFVGWKGTHDEWEACWIILTEELGFEQLTWRRRLECPCLEPGSGPCCPCSTEWVTASYHRVPPGFSVAEAISFLKERFPQFRRVEPIYPAVDLSWTWDWMTDYQAGPESPWYWPCPEDVNFDGRINILDLIFVRNRLGRDPSTGDNWQADVIHMPRGKINIADVIRVRNYLHDFNGARALYDYPLSYICD